MTSGRSSQIQRRAFLLAIAAPLVPAVAARLAAFQRGGKTLSPLPLLSYSCPMHPEVVDNEPGKCPLCGMTLEKVRLALVWTCPVHNEQTLQEKGQCRTCGRDLIRVTKAVSFTCPVHTTSTSPQ